MCTVVFERPCRRLVQCCDGEYRIQLRTDTRAPWLLNRARVQPRTVYLLCEMANRIADLESQLAARGDQ